LSTATLAGGSASETTQRSAARLSIILLTYNEETNLPACLNSVQGLDADVWVVDSGSTDGTLALAAAYGARTVNHPFVNYADQRNWALQHLPLETEWVLNLDADERLTPELVAEINERLAPGATEPAVDGYLLRKRTVFMDRWIRHGGHYPSFHLRLFKRHRGRCEDRKYDQHFVVDGRTGTLKNDYIDVVSSSLAGWTARHLRWAEMERDELTRSTEASAQVKPDVSGDPIQRRRWWRNTYARGPLFARAFAYWTYRYFVRLGFLDGTEGLIFHFLQGFWFRFLVDSLIYERRRA
jgi:glycosyltransferase involved in cell wall biosynthesis